jgi:type IV fimbrial biogenesis protein FimT
VGRGGGQLLVDAQRRDVQLMAREMNMPARGFTMIEIMIAMSIFALLLMLAGPMYAEFMANPQVRNAADSILSGVRRTQSEAVRHNTPARFILAAGTDWQIWAPDQDAVDRLIQKYYFVEGSKDAVATPDTGTQVTFNGLGRIIPNADASPSMNQINVTLAGANRNLRVLIGTVAAGGVKLCDPNMPAADPAGCP